MANKNDPPEHQAPDLESGFHEPDPPNPETSGTHFDGPPPDMSEMMVRVHGPGMYYVDEKGIAVPIPIQANSPTGRINITPPLPSDRVKTGVLPPQVVHLRKLFPNSDEAACGSPLSGPFTSWPHHVAILGSDFSKYLKDPILKPNLCPDCIALLKPEPTPDEPVEAKHHGGPQTPLTHSVLDSSPHPFGNRPKSVATAQVIHARNTKVSAKKGEPIDGLCGMKMPPAPKKLGDTLPSDRTVSDQVFRQYLLNEPDSRPANSTLCGTCISAFMPNPKPSFIGNLAVSSTAVNTDPKPAIIGDLAEARTDQHRRDLPEMPKTGDKMYFNENEPVPVVVLPGQRFEDIESGQKGHIIAQNLGTYLVDFKAEDGRVFKGLRQSRFVRHSDLRQWIKDNPGAHWMFPPPAHTPSSEAEQAMAKEREEAAKEAKEREAQENDLPLHTEEYNDTLPPIHPADPSTYPEPLLYAVVKGVMAWQFFLHVPSPSPTDPDRTRWVNTRADWYEWSYVYEHLCKKNPDGSPVILGMATTEEFNKLPTPADWNKIKQAARDLVELGKKIGLI